MEKVLKENNLKTYSSKIVNIFLLGVISYFMASTSNAFLFNPFILSTLYFLLSFSPVYYLIYSLFLGGFSLLINLNYGVEIFLIASFLIFIKFIIDFVPLHFEYKHLIPLLLSIIVISIRYLIINFSLASLFSLIISIVFTLVFSFSLIKIKNSFINHYEVASSIDKVVFFSLFLAIFLNVDNLNMLLISTLVLILIKFQKKEIVLSTLFLLFFYNYLFFNVSLDVLIIYLFSLSLSCINKKYSPLIFVLSCGLFYIIKDQSFYQNLSFYLIFLSGILAYYLSEHYQDFFSRIFLDEIEEINNLQALLIGKNQQINKFKNYLSLLKVNPMEEVELEDTFISNIKASLCQECPNYEKCIVKDSLLKYLTKTLNKEEKNYIINQCLYPYKLIRRIEMASKSFYTSLSLQEDKKNERELFINQIDTLLKPLNDDQTAIEKKNLQFEVDYQVITSSFTKENGDSYSFIEADNQFLMLLSDGMGHCLKSHQLSKYLIDVFTSLYDIDKNVDNNLENLNLILKTKVVDEMYATLDLANFDLSDGNVTIYKAGSFSSFLIRNNQVYQFAKISPPFGIIRQLNFEKEKFKIENNDIFIFLTDGFKEEVKDIIEKSKEYCSSMNLETFIKTLFKELNADKIKDDKTLIVIKVHSI